MSKPIPLTGSAGERARACAYSCALPADPRTTSDAADRGTAVHAFLERLQHSSREDALRECPDSVRAMCAAIDPDGIPLGHPEIAHVYNVHADTARRLGRISHREYPELADGDIPITLDLVTDSLTVVDWKTGRFPPAARDNMQLALGALCVARATGAESVRTAIAHVQDDGAIEWDYWTLDAWDLDEAADVWRETYVSVTSARAKLASGEPIDVSPGEHCRYCPAKGSCPEYATEARELAAPMAHDWLARYSSAIATDEGAAEWWERLARISEITATMRGVLEARAAQRPFTLSDGSLVSERVSMRERVINADVVHAVLAEMHGDAVANAACVIARESTKGAIEKAVRSAGGDVKVALRVLRERGGIESRESRVVEARKRT